LECHPFSSRIRDHDLVVNPKNDKGVRIPLDVKVGDRILWSKYSGTDLPIKIGNEDYLIVREDEVLGVIEAAKHGAGGKK
jgi:co-chaperonin GroES (HSP10)